MRPSSWAWVLAVGLFVVGLVVGFSPVRSQGYACGNGFASDQLAVATQQTQTAFSGGGYAGPVDCAAARSGRVVLTWGLLAGAVVVGGGAMVAAGRERDVLRRVRTIEIRDLELD